MYYRQIGKLSAGLFCLVILNLFITGQLTLYIHPRYVLFTVSMITAAFIFLIISLRKYDNKKLRYKLTDLIVVIMALVALILPASTLSYQTATNRLQTTKLSESTPDISSYDSFSQDFTHFDIVDWATLLSSQPPDNLVVGKNAKFYGFIFSDGDANKYIARFKLSCCAVDATPLTVRLINNDLTNTLDIGAWYEVEGKFIKENNQFLINLNTVKRIDEPEEPYVY